MGLFTKKIGPVILKETYDADLYIQKLESLLPKTDGVLRNEIEKEIRLTKAGLYGEREIAYQLKSSGMDMFILHDIYLPSGDEPSAQIDYIIITRKRIYIIECKNLNGHIEVDSEGNFHKLYKGKRLERIKSPIEQNQMHVRKIKSLTKKNIGNALIKAKFEKNFDTNYKSIVVWANLNAVLDKKYAPKEIKDQLIHADLLVEYLRKTDAQIKNNPMSEKKMRKIAQFYLDEHRENPFYAEKYAKMLEKVIAVSAELLEKKLTGFRSEKSRQEKIPAYYIFTNECMKDLIEKNPATKEELLQVTGLGPKKVKKYGDELLRILSECRIN